MKKNILLLINGFGVERSDSYSVYNGQIMPNLDRLTREGIFSTIPNKYLDYKSAFRNFSMGTDHPLTYSIIDNNINSGNISSNQLLQYIISQTVQLKSRLHIVCFWESDKTIENLNSYLNIIKKYGINRIFLHLVLCQKSITEYKEIDRKINSLNYDLNSNIKIGIVTGENNFYNLLNAKDLVKNYMTEFGEKWKDLSKKVEVLVQTKTVPCDARTFSVNPTYRLENNDQVLFFNFNNIDISLFRRELFAQKYRQVDFNTIKFYSLFPLKAEVQIPFMYNYAVAANYTLDSLQKAKASCLVYDKKDNCGFINYYLTGLRNTIDERLKYIPTDDDFIYDKDKLIESIKTYNRDFYIINYNIEGFRILEDLKKRLTQIDTVIGALDEFIKENNYGLFITSLYGMETEMYNNKQELVKICFAGKAPVIIDDNKLRPTSYSMLEGTLFDLGNTILKNINHDFKAPSTLLKRKAGILSILYKKPKGGKKK